MEKYQGSACLENCLNLIASFELVSGNGTYYWGDLEEFIKESKYEDFYAGDRCKLYVGMTRARDRLYIHCNTDLFPRSSIPGAERITDPAAYPPPLEITLQLTRRDVVLDFFRDKKAQILRLRSGGLLRIEGNRLTAQADGQTFRAAKLS